MGLAPGRPSTRGGSACRARRLGAVCAWQVWGLNPRLRGYLIAVVVAGFAAIGGAAGLTRWQPGDAVMYGSLLAFGVVTIEVLRRLGEPAGASKDAHGLWELSIAVLLPPFYSMTAPFVVMALAQWRVRRTLPHRRVFSAAAVGLSYGAASLAFHAGWDGSGRLPGGELSLLAWGMLALACGMLRWMVNNALVLTAIRLDDPTAGIRDLLGGSAVLGNDIAELCVGVLIAFAAAAGPVLLVFALPCGTLLQRSARHAHLLHASRTDPKTGLLSAVTWQREAAVQVAEAIRTRSPLAVAIVDIDHFAAVSETYGPQASDQVLRTAAQTLVCSVQGYDIPGRFGGEEFTLLLSHMDAAQALRFAERLRGRLSDIAIAAPAGGGADPPRITVSIGVAALADTITDLTDLLTAADAALYQAKRAGHNTVRLAE